MKVNLIILVLLVPVVTSAQSQDADKNIRAGNEFYKQQQFEKAATAYEKAIEADPNSSTAKFNLANSLYKQNKEDESVKIYAEVAVNAGKKDIVAKSYYNKGAVLSRQEKREKSIEAYKNCLRLNPGDKEARENLQKALLELKKKNPPKKKEEQEKKKQQQEQQKQKQSRINPQEAEQRLKLLAQKEKEAQQRIQKEKSNTGGSQVKDW